MDTIIEVNELFKAFGKGKNRVEAVRGISLQIYEGEIFGFLGPNGAGKTTCLKMMVGLLKPDSGVVKILGVNPNINGTEIKRKLGIIPQMPTFYEDLTVQENLEFIARIYDIPILEARDRINQLITQVGLKKKRDAITKTLSGGQKRRLNLILALVHDPQIILCDEPTPGLDPQSRMIVWDFIKKLPTEGKTVILTTHYMEEADRLSNRIAIIDHGEILVLNSPDQLKASVGKGDIVEISLKGNEPNLESIMGTLKDPVSNLLIEDIFYLNRKLVIRARDLIPKLNRILSLLEKTGAIEIENLSIRGTTLEDVFIHLTGRSLRE
jgi:ABC-2 type transport system ATP-binding protein